MSPKITVGVSGLIISKLQPIILVMIITLCCCRTGFCQTSTFTGLYKSSGNGTNYFLRLTNQNGSVTGNFRNAQFAGQGSLIKAKLIDPHNMKGTQKQRSRKRRFVATEESGEIIWEIKGKLLNLSTTRSERTYVFQKVDESTAAQPTVPAENASTNN